MKLLYDGECVLCIAGSRRLVKLARPGSVERASFRESGALEKFPQVSAAACESAMQLVRADGTVAGGPDAVRAVLATRAVLRPLAWAMGLPGFRWMSRVAYDWIARNRFRLLGRVSGMALESGAVCENGACRRR